MGIPRRARINVHIEPLGATAAELRLWPRSRHIRSWGRRRQARYFELAHASADLLVALLAGQAAIAPPDSTWVEVSARRAASKSA